MKIILKAIGKGLASLLTAVIFFALPVLAVRWLWPGEPKYDLAIYLGTGLVVLWYTLETRGMRQEMMASRRRLETPEVLVRLEQTRAEYLGFFDIVVENISDAPASDLRFHTVPDLPMPPGNTRRTKDIGFLKHGIRYLGPRQNERAFFLAYRDLTPDTQHSTITFEYSFKAADGRVVRRTIPVSLASYYDITMIGFGFRRELVTELKSLNTSVGMIAHRLSDHGGPP